MGIAIDISLTTTIFVCIMVGLGGFVDAAVGGGGLISVPAYLLTGLPARCALGCNKFSAACGTTFAVFNFWRHGAIDVKTALTAACFSFLGSSLGTKAVLIMGDETIKTVMLFALPAAAALISVKRNFGAANGAGTLSGARAAAAAALIGLFIGFYDGLVGPGTGTFAIIAFSLIMKYDLMTSSGNAKILNAASNYASLMTFMRAGAVYLPLAAPAALCGIAGSCLGSACAISRGAKFLRPMLMLVMAALLVKIACDLLR